MEAYKQNIFQIGILLVVAIIFSVLAGGIASIGGFSMENSVEVGVATLSPLGVSGGFAIPASCPSYAHNPGECTPPTFTATGGSGSGSNIFINEGSSATLEWQGFSSSSCSGVNFSTGGAVSGSAVVTPADTTQYTVICSNGGQSSVTVNVLHPDLSITATPSLLQSGDTTSIAWFATSVNSCSVSENNSGITDSWSGTSGTQISSPITEQTIYTLTCLTDGGALSESVTVNLIPVFQEF
ncbi:hypothetical protein HYW58_02460 [Candidatus Kaiserbacteria bacterium]|nr:hypothetical protein [Candidatus Kaiserbacteria bacterium]